MRHIQQGRTMTLHQFQTLTANVPAPVLRRAMTVALSVEAPRAPAGYARFYCRVLAELGVALGTGDCAPKARQTALVAA